MQDGHFFHQEWYSFHFLPEVLQYITIREFKNLRYSRKPFHHWHTISFLKEACALGRGLIQDPSALSRRAELAVPLLLGVEVKLVWQGCSLALTPHLSFLLHISSAFRKLPPVPAAYPFRAFTSTEWTHPCGNPVKARRPSGQSRAFWTFWK